MRAASRALWLTAAAHWHAIWFWWAFYFEEDSVLPRICFQVLPLGMEKAPSAYPVSPRLFSFYSCAVLVPVGSGFILGPIHEKDSSPLSVNISLPITCNLGFIWHLERPCSLTFVLPGISVTLSFSTEQNWCKFQVSFGSVGLTLWLHSA